ncbi:MAG: hypothetical protein RBT71_10750 [Flavobacteriales bacterium]|nr:hypothetical protein [Flavobacteriales bacterium]
MSARARPFRTWTFRAGPVPWALLGLTALALILRTALVLHHQDMGWQLRDDAAMYHVLAGNLRHGVFSMFHPQDIPDTIKRPGYPWLVHLTGNSVLLTLLLQSLLSALKVPLVHILGRTLGLRTPFALAAAALMAIEPMDILLSAQLLTEAVFGTLVLAGTVMLVRGGRWPAWAGAALLFGAAAWVRPNGLALALVAGAAAAIWLRHGMARSAVFIGLVLLAVLPWALRNHRVMGRFHMGESAVVAAGYYQVPQVLRAAGDDRGHRWRQVWNGRASAMDWTDRTAYHAFFDDLRAEVRATLRAHPLTWARVHAEKAARIAVAPGRGHIALFFRRNGIAANALIAVSLGFSLLVLFGTGGAVFHWRTVPRGVWLLLLMSAALIAMGAITTADARFKNPAMGLLVVAACWAMQRWGERRSA